MFVRYLTEARIESAAVSLLSTYGARFGEIIEPPVPVEYILECILSLSLSFEDLRAKHDGRDVLGALCIDAREVLIDESLAPDDNPEKKGRYHFTLAHELGHWELHRHQLQRVRSAPLLVQSREPSIICRESERNERPEWQANSFAAYLLMPEAMVRHQWINLTGSDEPYVAQDELKLLQRARISRSNCLPTVEIARRMARALDVSGQAMQVRLLGLKLILTEEPPPGLFD